MWWKTVVAVTFFLLGGGGSALAQSNPLTQVRNDTNARWTLGLGCGSTVFTLDPHQFVYLESARLFNGCTMTMYKAPAKEAASTGTQVAQRAADNVCGVSKSGAPYCAAGSKVITVKSGRIDKPALLLLDGVLLATLPVSTDTVQVAVKTLTPVPHTLTLIGSGKGLFNVAFAIQMTSGRPDEAAVNGVITMVQGPSPDPFEPTGSWVITKTF